MIFKGRTAVVIAVGQDEVPAFWSRNSGLPAPLRMDDPAEIAALGREYAGLRDVVGTIRDWQGVRDDLDAAREMLSDPDPELRALADEELQDAQLRREQLELELQKHLVPLCIQ